MRIGLDTSVMMRLLTGAPAPAAALVAGAVNAASVAGDELIASDLAVSECYFALQHHYALSKAQAIATLREFFRASPIQGSANARAVLATPNLATAKPGFVDRLIHAEYRARAAEQVWTCENAGTKLTATRLVGGS